MKKYLLFLCLFILVTINFQSCVQTSKNIVTEYQQKTEKIPLKWRGDEVVLLENSTDLKLIPQSDGNHLIQTDTRWYYINRVRPSYMDRIEYYESEAIEKPIQIDIEAFYPDDSSWQPSAADVRRKSIKMTSAIRNEVDIPKYTKGMMIRLVIKHDFFRPEFIGTFPLRSRFPALKRTITFVYPKEYDLIHGLENDENISVNQSDTTEGGQRRIEISVENLSDRWPKSKVMLPEQWYATFHVCIPPKGKKSYTWQELGDHYLELVQKAFDESSKIVQLGESVKGANRTEIIKNSFATVTKKIRYLGDWEKDYAYIPRKASVVLDHGYGDCKEISTLLKMLLKTKQIEAYLALVATKGNFQLKEKYPNLSNFNHAVLAIEKTNGTYRFLDGTVNSANADNSFFPIINRKSLLLIPGRSKVTTIHQENTDLNQVITKSTIEKNPRDGNWQISGKVTLRGTAALSFFMAITHIDTTQKTSLAKIFLQSQFGLNPTSVDYVAEDSNEAVISYTAPFQENYIAMRNGGFKLCVPRVCEWAAGQFLDEKVGPKTIAPITQKDTWVLPFSPRKSSLNKYNHSFSQTKWKIDKQTVTRIYAQIEKRFKSDDQIFKNWFKQYKTITEAVVWK